MILLLLIIASACVEVFGQIEGNIVFPGVSELLIVNGDSSSCICVPVGTCSTVKTNDSLDVRIVNNGNQGNCDFGTVLCCSNNSTIIIDPTCGVRKITQMPQPVLGQASFGAYPWHALIISRHKVYVGSGVLLQSNHVVTAAHLINAYVNNPSMLLVRLGEWNVQSTSEPYPSINVNIGKIIVHPNFNANTLENDVAVIKLNGIVPITSYPNINTACKPVSPPATGTRCYVSGLGKNAFGINGTYQSIMKEVDVPIIDINDCENRLRQTRLGVTYMLNKNSFICAGGESGKDACTGDGGAPLVCQRNQQWEVVGLVSWGIGCGTAGVPGVYTNIYNFLGWINQVIMTV